MNQAKSKREMIRDAVVALAGPQKVYEAVGVKLIQQWVKKNYFTTVSEARCYEQRKFLVNQRQLATNGQVPTQTQVNAEDNGIVTLVSALKNVVSRLGKDETKKLVDVISE